MASGCTGGRTSATTVAGGSVDRMAIAAIPVSDGGTTASRALDGGMIALRGSDSVTTASRGVNGGMIVSRAPEGVAIASREPNGGMIVSPAPDGGTVASRAPVGATIGCGDGKAPRGVASGAIGNGDRPPTSADGRHPPRVSSACNKSTEPLGGITSERWGASTSAGIASAAGAASGGNARSIGVRLSGGGNWPSGRRSRIGGSVRGGRWGRCVFSRALVTSSRTGCSTRMFGASECGGGGVSAGGSGTWTGAAMNGGSDPGTGPGARSVPGSAAVASPSSLSGRFDRCGRGAAGGVPNLLSSCGPAILSADGTGSGAMAA